MDFRNRQKYDNKQYYSSEQVKRVLQSCGINIELEIDSDYIIYCPYHSNFRTPAAEVSKSSGHFFCFGCQQSANLIELVKHCSNRTYFEACRLIDSKKVDVDIYSEIGSTLNKPAEFIEFDSDMINNLHNNLRESKEARDYLASRGITTESMQKYTIGYSLKRMMVTIPIYSSDGMCVGFVGRSIQGKEFSNSPGLPRSKTLFNIQRVKFTSQVFVVESTFDAIRIEQAGRPAVATLGSNVSGNQIALLKKYFTSIILLPDNDEAGKSQTRKLTEAMPGIVTVGTVPQEYKDISDMNDNELQNFIYKFDNMVEYLINI